MRLPVVDWNEADAAGGAVFNVSGTLTVQDSVLGRDAADNAVGGGVVNGDKATFTDSELSDDFAGRDGGAIRNEGVLAVVGGLVADGRAVLGGGGINDEGSATLTRVKVGANSAGASAAVPATGRRAGPPRSRSATARSPTTRPRSTAVASSTVPVRA